MTNAHEFTSRLLDLLRREQGAMADFLIALSEFDRKRFWVGLGYTSLFYFLHRELKLSSGASYHRKTAAELIQRFPEIVEPLRDGRLCLSSVCELAKVISRENLAEVLPRFFHSSKQEAKAVAAGIAPQEAVPRRMVVTAVAAQAQASAGLGPATSPTLDLSQPFHPGETPLPPQRMPAPPAALQDREEVRPASLPTASSQVVPLTAEARRLHVTVSKRFLEKLDAARDALSHSRPGADAEAILEAGLDLILERADRRRGLVKRPRGAKSTATEDPRHVPAHVSREVWTRDRGRCQWPVANGSICGSTHRVELDHVVPVARGGRSTPENLRMLCGFHNDLAARQVFGNDWMDRFTRGSRVLAPAFRSG